MVEHDAQTALRVRVSEGEVQVVQPDRRMRLVRAGQVLSYISGEDGSLEPLPPSGAEPIEATLAAVRSTGPPASTGSPTESVPTQTEAEEPAVPTGEPNPQGSLAPDMTARPAPTPGAAQPDQDEIRAWIVARDYNRAETALRARLRQEPRSAGLWWLLAECVRTAGDSVASELPPATERSAALCG